MSCKNILVIVQQFIHSHTHIHAYIQNKTSSYNNPKRNHSSFLFNRAHTKHNKMWCCLTTTTPIETTNLMHGSFTASYYTSCSSTNTTRQAFEDNNQRTSHFVACNTSYASLKPSRDQSSPVSTLSPPDVSTTATTTTTAAGAEMSGEVVQMLQVLESALLDDDEDDDMNGSFHQGAAGSSGGADHHMMKSLLETSQLERLLVTCAEAVAENDFQKANVVIAKLNHMVSIHGDPMQRLAAYMLEGLVARMVSSGGGLYKALKCKVAPAAGGGDLLSAMQVLYDVCPYFKFGYMAANGAIAEAFQNEDRVHIIDFEINQGVQWSTLIQALAARPGGPPHLRITGVDDPSSEMTPPGGLKLVGNRLRKLAQSVGVPFVFHAVEKKCPEVQAWMLERQHGEALAVNFALQLHHVPDESVCTTNPRDRMLQMVKSLGPKVVTLVEQEANTNTAPFLPRFIEAMKYYSAVFQSLDVTLGRDSRERINVEQQCLARDLVNVIACEGAERVERHEMLGKWRARMSMAGFRPRSLSASVNNTIKMLLEAYSDKYRLQEEGGALSLGWMNRSLIVASAWH
ncbi:unnamed protein product [Sphagnum troendelagicum]